jgi:pyridoxal phosphate enzyme (YggS family)
LPAVPFEKNVPTEMASLGENLERVKQEMAAAAARASRSIDEIDLVAVSKKQDAEKIRAVEDAGQLLFGESRVQEARAKIPLLPARLRWHFIGHLQKNKIRHALPLFELFHGIDSLALAQEMDRIAADDGLRPRALLEVNVSGEASKHGFAPEDLRRNLETVLSLGRLSIEGLMTMAPVAPEAEASRKYFAALCELRDRLEGEFNVRLPELSMGMSSDFPVAIEEGATLVRVGSAIFDQR